ncbi:hypothetical protein CO2235_MP20091 [Cupriavidus oxalaticus]|uniref:Uncharacterized protein n=1 Tax=Cupriavidus oxalaticus TaxID=96344 RepID=A0A976BHB2_9BURK|nr:hypothetical protein CO2235_MP20091 [Cupriavidus oxalaticus]
MPPEDAIGKAGSGCFPDLPKTGYCQTLRVTERSPQKSVSDAAWDGHVAASGNFCACQYFGALPPAAAASVLAGLPGW